MMSEEGGAAAPGSEMWEIAGVSDHAGRFAIWTSAGQTFDLRIAPPGKSGVGRYEPAYNDRGELDLSHEVVLRNVQPGSTNLVVRL